MEACESDREACLTSWKDIWENAVTHNENAKWLPGVRESLDMRITDNQSNPTITPDQDVLKAWRIGPLMDMMDCMPSG